MDAAKNFAKVTVSTGYNAAATSIVLTTGHAARLPAVPFNCVWHNLTDFPDPSDDPNVEIVRVTAIVSETLTITRAQESTSASTKNTASKTYQLIAGPTAKLITDIAADIAALGAALNASNLTSGTIPDARFPATLPAASGVNLTALDASNLGSGTVPDARFPATLPAVSGANLTNLDATDLASGTIPDARFPATLPAASGANLTSLNATNLASGTVPDARFPATLPAASGANLTALNASNLSTGTLPDARFPAILPAVSGANLTNLPSGTALGWLNVLDYGAEGDGKELSDGAITNADATFTSATAAFTVADVGKIIFIDGAGSNSAFGSISGTPARAPLVTTIASVTNSTTVELTATAQATVSGARFVYGTDDTAALQAAADDLDVASGQLLLLPSGQTFFQSAAITLPRPTGEDELQGGGSYGVIGVSGYGARLINSANTAFITISPSTVAAIYYSPIIEGLSFEGYGGATQIPLAFSHTYGARLSDLKMRRVGIGVDLQFGLMARISNVMVDYFTQYGIRLRTATGPTPTNAAVIDGARCRPSSIGLSSFNLLDTDQCELRNCVSEQPSQWAGSSFIADVIFDNTNTLGAYGHGLLVNGFYSEVSAYTTAMFKVVNDGYCVLEGITHQHEISGPLVDATGSDPSTIVCRDWTLTTAPIAPANSWISFKQDAADQVAWLFENMGEAGRAEVTDLTLSAFWVGGNVPSKLTQIEPGRVSVPAVVLVSAEIGNVAVNTVVGTFSDEVKAANYATGVVIEKNASPATISSSARQADKTKVHWVLSASADGGDDLTVSYSAIDGFLQTASGAQVASVVDKVVTNNIGGAAALLEDTFTDTNGTTLPSHTMDTGSGWTKIEGNSNVPTIQSNKLQSTADAAAAYTHTADAGAANVTIEMIGTLGSGGTTGDHAVEIALRASDGTNMWIIGINDVGTNNMFIATFIAGVYTVRDQATISLSAGTPYTLVVTATGNDVSFTVDGGAPVAATNAFNNTVTTHGIRLVHLGGAANTVDDFVVTG